MDSCDHHRSVSVAVVDDDEAILDAVRLVLEDHGWRVRAYATGESFIADLNDYHPDCIILDPHLPGVSGADVARRLAEHHSHIPIIGLTARPDSALADEVEKAGTVVMLTKPITFEDLVDEIEIAISRAADTH